MEIEPRDMELRFARMLRKIRPQGKNYSHDRSVQWLKTVDFFREKTMFCLTKEELENILYGEDFAAGLAAQR